MKRPILITGETVLIDADSELICDTEGATPEELKALVEAFNGQLFTPDEQKAMWGNPLALEMMIDHNDFQQDQADSIGLECYGNRIRSAELRARAAEVIAEDPDLWPNSVRKRFGFPEHQYPEPQRTQLQDLVNHLQLIKIESRMLVASEQAEWLRERIQAAIDPFEVGHG